MGRLGRLRSKEEGQTLPALLLLMVSILAAGAMLLNVGSASILRADGVSSADAAAIAGGKNLKSQLMRIMAATGYPDPTLVNPVEVCAHAAEYAALNDGTITNCQVFGYEVFVSVVTNDQLDEEDIEEVRVGVEGTRATAKARAKVTLSFAGFPSIPGGVGGLGLLQNVPIGALKELAEKAGVDILPNSSLLSSAPCMAGADTVNLSDEMKIAILEAEDLLGHPLSITDGFRTFECQAALAANPGNPGGRAAPPGSSLHERGWAIDVANYRELGSIAAEVGLCQPFPAENDDPFHFSLAAGPECGGVAGVLGPGGAFGGNLGSYVTFDVILVE